MHSGTASFIKPFLKEPDAVNDFSRMAFACCRQTHSQGEATAGEALNKSYHKICCSLVPTQ